jgi:hypothetical protein
MDRAIKATFTIIETKMTAAPATIATAERS